VRSARPKAEAWPKSIEAGLKSQLPKELAVVLQPCEAQPLEVGKIR